MDGRFDNYGVTTDTSTTQNVNNVVMGAYLLRPLNCTQYDFNLLAAATQHQAIKPTSDRTSKGRNLTNIHNIATLSFYLVDL
jgi:hypothetical protein